MKKLHQSFVLTLGALACASAVNAADAAAPAAPAAPLTPAPVPVEKGWETTAAAGVTLTAGNSETFLATVSLDTKRKWAHDEAAFGITGGYGTSETKDSKTGEPDGKEEETAKFARGFGQYNHLFTERLYGGIRLDAEYDAIAGVDYRIKVSPLVGYYLVKNAKTSLSVEAGPSFVFEDLDGRDAEQYVGLRFGERFEHQLTDTTKIWQSFEYLPRVENWGKYLLNAQVGIDSAITKQWSLRVVGEWNFNSDPANYSEPYRVVPQPPPAEPLKFYNQREESDFRLIAGVSYKF